MVMRCNQTIQGKVIVEALGRVKTHPTADEIFEMVRRRLPRISKGTVYRNLEKLSELGEILCLNTAGRQRRYDGDTSPHFHMRCTECGAVCDVPLAKHKTLSNYLTRLTRNAGMQSCTLEFSGACQQCKAEGAEQFDNLQTSKEAVS